MNLNTLLSANVSRKAKIIYLRRYMGFTHDEIGSIFGITRQRVQVICQNIKPIKNNPKVHKMTKIERQEIYFWKNVQISEWDFCWIWTGSSNGGNGSYRYGTLDGRTYAHRFSYFIHNPSANEEERNLEVCHRCNNSLCVNPAHLYLGTHEKNMEDRTKRYESGELTRKGEKKSKHSDDIVRELKLSPKPYALARKIGIPYGSVYTLLKRSIL